MSVNGYEYSSLSKDELNEIQKLEDELNQNRDDDSLIILAFEDKSLK
jgi:hypothetical protein